MGDWVRLCDSQALIDGADAVPFEVRFDGHVCRAFAVRFEGQVHAYLNRCSHVAMEMDWLPNRLFDDTGRWLLCATHGATYAPDSGQCVAGPCQGGLIKVPLEEREGVVYWSLGAPFGLVAQ